MSRIDELIERLCPDGVEYKSLISVANIQYGFAFESDLFTSDSSYIPLIRIRDVVSGKASTYYSGSFIEDYIVHKGDILVGMDGNFNLARWNDRNGLLNQRVCKIKSKDNASIVLDGFLFHYLGPVFLNIEKSIQGSTVKHLSAKKIKEIKIPVPPLEIQEEIVCVLDSFAELEVELEAELEAELERRKAQYAYYRDQLFNFTDETQTMRVCSLDDVKHKKIEDICLSTCSGGTPSKSHEEYYGGDIPWLRTQDVNGGNIVVASSFITQAGLDNSSAKWIPINCVIVAMYGATAGKVAINKFETTTNQACCNLEIDSKIASYKYVYYWLSSQYDQLKGLGEGSQHNINAKKVKSFNIPVPPLEEQQRIVDILDKFDALVNGISQGLLAEIEARRKQYEYYRDKLLTFKEKVN